MKIRILNIWIIFLSLSFVFGQTHLPVWEQSSAGGKVKSSVNSSSITGIMGQPTSIGKISGNGTSLYSGYIPMVSGSVKIDPDIIAPEAPAVLSASPSGWSQENGFDLNWTNPAGDTTIAGVYYKIGSVPTSNTDGELVQDAAISSLTGIAVGGPGEFEIYIWLRDEAGNADFNNRASTTLQFDNINPQFNAFTPDAVAPADIALSMSASASDIHSGIDVIKLYYRKTGEAGSIDSVNFSGGSASIPATIHTQRGSEFFLKAYDNAGNYDREPETGFHLVTARVNEANGGSKKDAAGNDIAQHSGSTVNDYRILSVPFVLDAQQNTPKALLEDDLGSYDNTKWKFYRIVNNNLEEYPSFLDQPVIRPGRGFLILVKDGGKVINTGSGVSTNETHSQVPLVAGWNIVGNPFDFDIPLDSLKINGVSIDNAWYLSPGGWVQNPPHLKKWEGLTIHSDVVATLNIGLATGDGSDFSISNYFEDEWGFRLSTYGESSSDLDNFMGVYSKASKLPRTKWLEPFALGAGISLHINSNESEQTLAKSSTSNLSSQLQEKNATGNSWDFEVTGSTSGESILIDFEMFGNLPDGFSAQVVDKNSRKLIDLQEIDYALDLTMGSTGKREYRMVVGDAAYIESQSSAFLVPDLFELKQNYPNPFNPSTKITYGLPNESRITLEIYNILGQKVITLINNQTLDAGYHTTQWNGTNDLGNQVASGVYIIKLKGEKSVKIKKAVLIR